MSGLLDRFQVDGTDIGPEDPDAAASAAGRYGTHKSAQKIIEANTAQYPEEVLAVGSLPIDRELTEALDMDAVAKVVKDRGELDSATVRKAPADDEAYIMAIVLSDSGRSARYVFPVDSLSAKDRPKAEGEKPAPKRRSRAKKQPAAKKPAATK